MIANLLGNFNTNGTICYIPNSTGAAVVEFVRHTTVNGRVNFNVDIVSDLVGVHVCGQWDSTMFTEVSLEECLCSGAITVRMRHSFSTLIVQVKSGFIWKD